MNDSKLIDWMEMHCKTIFQKDWEDFSIEWFDCNGYPRRTDGCNLRDCILGAMIEQKDKKPQVDRR